ncbi:MAG: molybdopterin molybdotransferase MoeA, partial [Bacteroidales bacterium]|nr:molybdopterin molybdotransferase MoeA [Bacteroidales bacterium]
MISHEEALAITEKYIPEKDIEFVPFMTSLGRLLAEDIISDIDMPPFDKTAVDGYACRREDLGRELVINEIVAAGQLASAPVEEGRCVKIMTGAAMPEGTDWVFMVEDAEERDGRVKFTGKAGKDNIAKLGEDIRVGDTVLKAGKIIVPQDIAVMATVGAVKVAVRQKPLVGIISTGDELVEPRDKPGPAQIRNSNAYQLTAQTIRAGGEAVYYGIAPDDEGPTLNMLSKAISECDIVLLTGGVSMGDYDEVPAVMRKAGVDIIFDRIAVQPGKPTTFGVHQKAIVFGLPGNPVSSFIQFEIFVRPMIMRAMGLEKLEVERKYELAADYTRKRSHRMAWVPVSLESDGTVAPVEYHGSAHINALPAAWGIMKVPVGLSAIKKGETVDVRQI